MNTCTAILTYHSQNIAGDESHNNDHVALREDLQRLHAEGLKVAPLDSLAESLDQPPGTLSFSGDICLTFDDGCDFDVRDIDYPGFGLQRSLLGILQDFISRHGAGAQPGLHATSFVIASEQARRLIDERSLFGKGWISDDWWGKAADSGLMTIGNHGWDHNHPDLAPVGERAAEFASVNTKEQCDLQVIEAARFIASRSGAWPGWFAYPFGESSAYIRESYFPKYAAGHNCHGALGTDPGHVTSSSDRWNLPRYVCGRDWRTPGQLIELLKANQPSR
jgi:peptidoglycan/xylan/chitin deacetylase (PgdA/CDA1 family)